MIKLFIKFILGILMIPLAVGVSLAFYHHLLAVKELNQGANLFLWGIVSYMVMHILFYRPTAVYVFGHELVHAATAWLFGGRIKSFKVSKAGGSVGTDKSNTIIELSPYFIPLYTIIITVVYFVIASSYSVNGSAFIFLIGFTLALHLISTIEVIRTKQLDFIRSGYFFSVIFVYLFNLLVISVVFNMVFRSFAFKNFLVDVWLESRGMYAAVIRQLFF